MNPILLHNNALIRNGQQHWCIPVITGDSAGALSNTHTCARADTHTHTHPGLINIHAEWHNMAGLKRSHPPAGIQAFLSLPNSFILFKRGLNLLEKPQSSPAAAPVVLGEHRVGSLPFSLAWQTSWDPSSFSLWGQWCRRGEEESDT